MFRLLKNNGEKRGMFLNSINALFMIGGSKEDLINAIFECCLWTIEKTWLKKMRCCDFIVDYVEKLYYDCHRVSLYTSHFDVESPDWVKNKHVTTNYQNNDEECC